MKSKEEEIRGNQRLLVLADRFENLKFWKMEDLAYYLAQKKQGGVNASTWKYITGTGRLLCVLIPHSKQLDPA